MSNFCFLSKNGLFLEKKFLTNSINKSMKILPYDNLTYKTHLSKEEILKRLSNQTEGKQWIRMSGVFSNQEHKAYEGTINENDFKINRIIGYRNSFLPRIEGEIEEINNENQNFTLIHLKMRLHTFVIVFIIIWLSFVFLGGLFMIFLTSMETENQDVLGLASIVPFLMIIILPVVITLAFHYEGNKSKEFFEKIFEAERLNNLKE